MSKRLNVLVENCGECPHVSQVITSSPIGSIWMCSFKRRVVSREGRLPDTIPLWCPLPDDVPLKVAAHVTHMELVPAKEPEQPFPVGTVIEIDDWTNYSDAYRCRTTWTVDEYSQIGGVFLTATGEDYYPPGFTRSMSIGDLKQRNPVIANDSPMAQMVHKRHRSTSVNEHVACFHISVDPTAFGELPEIEQKEQEE